VVVEDSIPLDSCDNGLSGSPVIGHDPGMNDFPTQCPSFGSLTVQLSSSDFPIFGTINNKDATKYMSRFLRIDAFITLIRVI
jgi:hypothetical protein